MIWQSRILKKKALAGESAPYRRKLDKNKGSILAVFKNLLEAKEINLETYIKHIIKSYNYECLEYKKKQQDSATVSSDSSISNLDESSDSDE